jgi:hypothetical protein
MRHKTPDHNLGQVFQVEEWTMKLYMHHHSPGTAGVVQLAVPDQFLNPPGQINNQAGGLQSQSPAVELVTQYQPVVGCGQRRDYGVYYMWSFPRYHALARGQAGILLAGLCLGRELSQVPWLTR